MRTRTKVVVHIVHFVFLCAAVTATSACGKKWGPDGTIRSVTIKGATSLQTLGATSQLTAMVLFSDGTSRDETAAAIWYTSSPSVVTVTSAGLTTMVGYGETSISASYRGLSGTLRVRALPLGTFLLTGTVANGADNTSLSGAIVRVTSTAGTWSTTTDWTGQYGLPAVGDVTVRVEKPGFDAREQQLTVTGDARLNLSLSPTTSPVPGYRLTFIASSSCSLPSEVMRRTYTATVSESGETLTVTLSGADFVTPWGGAAGFTGVRSGNSVQFQISDDITKTFSFVELLPPARWLSHSGTASGTINGDSIVATLNGVVRVTDYPGEILVGQCQATDHKLELVR